MSKIAITRIFCRENYNYAQILSRKLQLRALVGRFSLQNTTVGRLEDYRTGHPTYDHNPALTGKCAEVDRTLRIDR